MEKVRAKTNHKLGAIIVALPWPMDIVSRICFVALNSAQNFENFHKFMYYLARTYHLCIIVIERLRYTVVLVRGLA